MRSWNPHTVLFRSSKVWANHVTSLDYVVEGLCRMQEGIFRM